MNQKICDAGIVHTSEYVDRFVHGRGSLIEMILRLHGRENIKNNK